MDLGGEKHGCGVEHRAPLNLPRSTCMHCFIQPFACFSSLFYLSWSVFQRATTSYLPCYICLFLWLAFNLVPSRWRLLDLIHCYLFPTNAVLGVSHRILLYSSTINMYVLISLFCRVPFFHLLRTKTHSNLLLLLLIFLTVESPSTRTSCGTLLLYFLSACINYHTCYRLVVVVMDSLPPTTNPWIASRHID